MWIYVLSIYGYVAGMSWEGNSDGRNGEKGAVTRRIRRGWGGVADGRAWRGRGESLSPLFLRIRPGWGFFGEKKKKSTKCVSYICVIFCYYLFEKTNHLGSNPTLLHGNYDAQTWAPNKLIITSEWTDEQRRGCFSPLKKKTLVGPDRVHAANMTFSRTLSTLSTSA